MERKTAQSFQDISEEHRAAAKAGEMVFFEGYSWSTGKPAWFQLCHADFFPEARPSLGFDQDGFFVRPVPFLFWPLTPTAPQGAERKNP